MAQRAGTTLPPAPSRWRAVLASLLVLAAVLGPLSLAAPAHAAPTSAPPSLVLVGVPGLRTDEIDPVVTPTLWSLAGRAGLASLSVRAIRSSTCDVDGWLTVGAGRRAGAELVAGGCPGAGDTASVREVGDGAVVASVAANQAYNDTLTFDATLGTLAGAVRSSGGCVAAVGPAAALAAAGPDGRVDVYRRDLSVEPGLPPGCVLTLVALDRPLPSGDLRRDELVRFDQQLATVIAGLGEARLIVAGLSDAAGSPHLHAVIDTGADAGRSTLLRSGSTRRPGLVQLTDITTTLLAGLDVGSPAAAVGSVWRPGAATERTDALRRLDDADRAAQEQRRLVAPFFLILIFSQIGLYAVTSLAIRKDWGRLRGRFLTVTRWSALLFAAAPGATFLANIYPWWRTDHPLPAVIAAVTVFDLAIVGVAAAGPWRRSPVGPVGVVAGITALVLGADVMTGSRLQETSLAGYTPLVAGRFYGFGNVAFALFATSALIAAACLAHYLLPRTPRWVALSVAVSVGIAAAVVDGAPFWGSDAGGILALVPGVFALGILLSGRTLGVRRLLYAVGLSAGAFAAVGAYDYSRPASSRTHLGRFVADLLAGNAGDTIRRKASANLDILTSSPLTLLVPFAVAFLTLVLLRPALSRAPALARTFDRSPAFRAGLLAVVLTCVVGFATNDSGIVIPSLAMTIAIPLAVAAAVETVRQDEVPSG